MDAQAGKVCLLVRQTDRESGVPSHCYAVRLDEQWKVESAVDLLPGLEKAGMCRDDRLPEGILCDGEGCFYVGTEEYGIFDSTGEFLKMMEVPGGNGSQVRHTCRLPDGRSKDIWPEETWSFRDVMMLVEGEGAAGDFTGVFGGETQELLLIDLVLRDIMAGRSSLVDWEGKECHFDSEEFIRVLEFCKKYGLPSEDRGKMSFAEIMEGIHNGNILAYRVGGDLKGFSREMAELGEDFHCVGFPTESSYGGIVCSYDGYIAMNADGENQKAAIDFIQYLLSERVQRSMGIRTVRRDVLTDNVKDGNMESEGFGTYQYPVFQNKGGEVIPLDGKPDGSSFLPEHLEILEKADYMSQQVDDLGMMVIEEAGAFFSGDMSAQEVAGTIQSRVWVYLNE